MMSRPFMPGMPSAGPFLSMPDEEYAALLAAHGWSARAIKADLDARKAYFDKLSPTPPPPPPSTDDLDHTDPAAQAVLRRRHIKLDEGG